MLRRSSTDTDATQYENIEGIVSACFAGDILFCRMIPMIQQDVLISSLTLLFSLDLDKELIKITGVLCPVNNMCTLDLEPWHTFNSFRL